MKDQIHRFLFDSAQIRGELVQLASSWQAAKQHQEYPEVVQNLLGQAFAAIALLSATIKFKGSMSLQINSDGPVTMLVVQCTSENTIRGTARWNSNVTDGKLYELCGQGYILINVNMDKNNEQYQSIVALGESDLSACLSEYFEQSEQLDTRLWLFSDDECATGILLQKLPDENDPDHLWEKVVTLTDTITQKELKELDVKEILHRLYNEDTLRLYDPEPISFRCGCSVEKIHDVIKSMGAEEACSILREQETISVDCEYCRKHYEFDAVDVEQLFASDTTIDIPRTKH